MGYASGDGAVDPGGLSSYNRSWACWRRDAGSGLTGLSAATWRILPTPMTWDREMATNHQPCGLR